MNIFNPDTQGSDPQGRFIDRNVAAGIFGTVLNATVFNQIGDENDNLIKAAGLTPSDKEVNQWLKAIQKLYGDADTVLKEELVRKIEALTASDIAFDDSISISASDAQNAIVALHTLIKALKADEVSFDDSISLGASNVQELGVKLNEKLNTEIDNLQTQIDTLTNATIIADGEEHPTGKYYKNAEGGRKPIYYRYFDKIFERRAVLGTIDEWKADKIFPPVFGARWKSNQLWLGMGSYVAAGSYENVIEAYYLGDNTGTIKILVSFSSSSSYGFDAIRDVYIEYTKTTDSWEY